MSDDRLDGFAKAARTMGLTVVDDRCELDVKGVRVRLVLTAATGKHAASVAAIANAKPTETTVSDGSYRHAEPGPRLEDPRPCVLRAESKFDRFGKRMRLTREIETGDAMFDQHVYVESDDDDATVRAFLSPSAVRAGAVDAVINRASVELFVAREAVRVVRKLGHDELFDQEKLRVISDAAAKIATGLPPMNRTRVRSRFTPRNVLVGSSLVVGFIAFALYTLVSSAHPLLFSEWVAMRWALMALPIVVLVAYFALRGRSSSHIQLAVVLGAACFGLPGLIGGGLLLANGKSDAPHEAHATSVTKKILTKSKNNTTYRFEIVSWIPNRATLEVHVDKAMYEAAKNGSRVTVTTQLGALGWPILRGVTLR